jgi:preprotein translocase subunit SecF
MDNNSNVGVDTGIPKKGLLRRIYEDHYKKLMIFTFLIFILAIGQIAFQTITTGDFMQKDVNLKGGLVLEINKVADSSQLEKALADKFPGTDISVRVSLDKTVIVSDIDQERADELVAEVEKTLGKLEEGEYSKKVMGESLGASFFRETFIALIVAFLCMGLVVFITFRTFVPGIAVILCAFCDILTTLAIVNLFGIKIGMAGIAAFLMLIGYSVDTDILLTTRVLKRTEGTVIDRVYGSIKTGMMMSITPIIACAIALFLIHSSDVKQIMIIVLIGLIVDMMYTWIQNAGILRIYMERRKNKGMTN